MNQEAELNIRTVARNIIQIAYAELLRLIELLPNYTKKANGDEHKCIALIKYVRKYRILFAKCLIVLRWRANNKFIPAITQIMGLMDRQNQVYRHVADLLYSNYASTWNKEAPCYPIPTSIDILATSVYGRLPTSILNLAVEEAQLEKLSTPTQILDHSFVDVAGRDKYFNLFFLQRARLLNDLVRSVLYDDQCEDPMDEPAIEAEKICFIAQADDALRLKLKNSVLPPGSGHHIFVLHGKLFVESKDLYTLALSLSGTNIHDPWNVLDIVFYLTAEKSALVVTHAPLSSSSSSSRSLETSKLQVSFTPKSTASLIEPVHIAHLKHFMQQNCISSPSKGSLDTSLQKILNVLDAYTDTLCLGLAKAEITDYEMLHYPGCLLKRYSEHAYMCLLLQADRDRSSLKFTSLQQGSLQDHQQFASPCTAYLMPRNYYRANKESLKTQDKIIKIFRHKGLVWAIWLTPSLHPHLIPDQEEQQPKTTLNVEFTQIKKSFSGLRRLFKDTPLPVVATLNILAVHLKNLVCHKLHNIIDHLQQSEAPKTALLKLKTRSLKKYSHLLQFGKDSLVYTPTDEMKTALQITTYEIKYDLNAHSFYYKIRTSSLDQSRAFLGYSAALDQYCQSILRGELKTTHELRVLICTVIYARQLCISLPTGYKIEHASLVENMDADQDGPAETYLKVFLNNMPLARLNMHALCENQVYFVYEISLKHLTNAPKTTSQITLTLPFLPPLTPLISALKLACLHRAYISVLNSLIELGLISPKIEVLRITYEHLEAFILQKNNLINESLSTTTTVQAPSIQVQKGTFKKSTESSTNGLGFTLNEKIEPGLSTQRSIAALADLNAINQIIFQRIERIAVQPVQDEIYPEGGVSVQCEITIMSLKPNPSQLIFKKTFISVHSFTQDLRGFLAQITVHDPYKQVFSGHSDYFHLQPIGDKTTLIYFNTIKTAVYEAKTGTLQPYFYHAISTNNIDSKGHAFQSVVSQLLNKESPKPGSLIVHLKKLDSLVPFLQMILNLDDWYAQKHGKSTTHNYVVIATSFYDYTFMMGPLKPIKVSILKDSNAYLVILPSDLQLAAFAGFETKLPIGVSAPKKAYTIPSLEILLSSFSTL